MNKNLLILKGLDKDSFSKTHNITEWDVLDIKEFIKKFRRIRKTKYNNIICGYQDLNDKNLQYPIKFFLLLSQANKRYFLDNKGRVSNVSLWRFIFIDTPIFC